jgi:hypothetical protein
LMMERVRSVIWIFPVLTVIETFVRGSRSLIF